MKRPWPFGYNFLGEILPWPWLAKITPWWLLLKIEDRYFLCWSNMASWKMFDGSVGWELRSQCFRENGCYCGYYEGYPLEVRQAAIRALSDQPDVLLASTKGDAE